MKHLRPLIAILLSLALLLTACAAFAEELPYLEQLSQNTYINTSLLTTESYPEVCIAPYYFSSMYISQYSEPMFIHFPCPANTFAADFEESVVNFIDMDYGRQYVYIARENYAYETFLNNCENDDYILADGDDGLAIYLEPEDGRAYALLSAADVAKGAKLEIRIYDSSVRNWSEQQAVDALTPLITEEAARVQNSMVIDRMDTYWTAGRFAGFNVICNATNVNGLTLTYTLPEDYFITEVDDARVSIAKIQGKDDALSADFNMETYTYVDYQLEEDPDHVSTVTIDGADYRIYAHWYNDEKITSAYVDRVISTTAGYDGDQTLYLTIDLDPDGSYQWTDLSALEADLTQLAAGIQFNYDQAVPDYHNATPYSATETPAAAAPASEADWTCSSCGTEHNTGNFCGNCGAARPTEVTCGSCGYVVPEGETPNFCPNCGNAF